MCPAAQLCGRPCPVPSSAHLPRICAHSRLPAVFSAGSGWSSATGAQRLAGATAVAEHGCSRFPAALATPCPTPVLRVRSSHDSASSPSYFFTHPQVNNLAGSLAYFFCLALWLTSLSAIRRRMYQVRRACTAPAKQTAVHRSGCTHAERRRVCRQAGQSRARAGCRAGASHLQPFPTPPPTLNPHPAQLFFRFHIICFLGFFLFACAHYAPCWSYFAPGKSRHSTRGIGRPCDGAAKWWQSQGLAALQGCNLFRGNSHVGQPAEATWPQGAPCALPAGCCAAFDWMAGLLSGRGRMIMLLLMLP